MLVTIEEGIIFSQFFGVLFSLSAIAFQMIIVSISKLFIVGLTNFRNFETELYFKVVHYREAHQNYNH